MQNFRFSSCRHFADVSCSICYCVVMRGHPNNNTLFMAFVKEATESLLMSLGGGTTINQFIPRRKTGELMEGDAYGIAVVEFGRGA